MTPFGERYSSLYDAFYAGKDYEKEIDLVLSLWDRHGRSGGKTALDYGCGTGRHCEQLARQCWTVTGVDSSPDMLALARERAKKTELPIAFLDHTPDGATDLVLSLFSVLNYLPHGEPLLAALKRLRLCLKPGGIAIFDVWNGSAVPFQFASYRERSAPGSDGALYTRQSVAELDWIQQKLEIRIDLSSRNGFSASENHTMYYQTPREFLANLRAAEWECLDMLPAYREAPVSPTDYNLLYVCRGVGHA
ncbi:MAG: class I SAM-dependent methyltransferase [Deltaproteobacteria bacterium]|nr:class I SAM-dependent methyltransferase [Deltaproteobacteria bacterium]MBI3294184.1 class I SAM-dependent methyltransferase [Deltaproteobacteria bacterium]